MQSGMYANQCRVLNDVFHKMGSCSDKDINQALRMHSIGDPIENVRQLLYECRALNPSLNEWLQTVLKRGDGKQDFFFALEGLSDHVFSLYYVSPKGRVTGEKEDLAQFLVSAKEDLLPAAAEEDRKDLLAQLGKIIESPSDHEDDDVDLAQYLQDVLRAKTKEEEKKARQISSEDLVFGNTLGRGGDAKVGKASWKGISGFAVKENRVRYYHDKEVDSMLGIRHPNVVRMIGHSSKEPSEEAINERNVLLMELMDGDLDELVSQLTGLHSELPLDYKVDILLQIARAMKYLHENKIVHRDLKPANILFAKQPAHDNGLDNFTLKIADFGCSRSPFDHKTMATAPIGTDGYMAQELLCERGNRELDTSMYGPAVDIYSFSMVCYKVLTGLDPHVAWRDVLEGNRPPLKASASCPQALLSFIQKCWDKDPDQRPSASQVYEFLLLFKYMRLLTTPAHKTSCLWYGITDTLLEKLVSILGKEWLETEARALEEGKGTSKEDLKLRKQVTGFLLHLSKKSPIQQIRSWLPFVRLLG